MNEQLNRSAGVWNSRMKVAFIVFAGIAAFLLIAEHRAHVLPYLPWLILAACPLMHLFMHGGHGGHGGDRGSDNGQAAAKQANRSGTPNSAVDASTHRHNGGAR